jgi:hypothetical protein
MAQRDTQVKFERMPSSGLRMQAGGGWAWALVDWQDNLIMVPVIQDIDRNVIEDALNVYWPTITTILWPEDLDVDSLEVEVKLAQATPGGPDEPRS